MSQLNMFTPTKPKPVTRPKGCTLIYEPRGRAREYARLACNVYRGCSHACCYCYSPKATFRQREKFINATTRPNFLPKLAKEAAKYQSAGVTGKVLLSFTTDPYQHLDVKEQVTRRTIEILHSAGLNVQILTKGGSRALRDLDLLGPNDAFATTLTLLDDAESLRWEPGAALPGDRIATIQAFHSAGVPTWVSLEPVLDPSAALDIIRKTHGFVDLFKVGKLNYHPHARTIDWGRFAREAIELLMSYDFTECRRPDQAGAGNFYIKDDLRAYLENDAR